MDAKDRWKLYPQMVGIALDQLVNALIPPFTTLSWPDETMSARLYRAARRGKVFAKLVTPAIDLLFVWQSVDPTIVGEDGQPIKPHCERAYWKEKLRRQLPPEERFP